MSTQLGGVVLKGLVEPDTPLLRECIFAILFLQKELYKQEG